MRRCPRCNRIYSEDDLNFCLDDGELLQQYSGEQPTRPLNHGEPPPTVVLDPPRATNPIGWDAGQNVGGPVGQWPGSRPASHPQHHAYAMMASPNQTLAVMSMGFGLASIVIGWCCYIGFLLGPAGIVMGIISLIQIKNTPHLYGGKTFAWIGIAAGGLFLVLYVLLIVLWGVISIIQP